MPIYQFVYGRISNIDVAQADKIEAKVFLKFAHLPKMVAKQKFVFHKKRQRHKIQFQAPASVKNVHLMY